MQNDKLAWNYRLSLEVSLQGQGSEQKTKCNFPALICFHCLSKAIIYLFCLHNSVWYKRCREEKGQTACVFLPTKHVMMCYTGNNCCWIIISQRPNCCDPEYYWRIIRCCSLLCVLVCVCDHMKTLSLTTFQHREQAWSHHPQWTQWICSEIFRTTRK